MVGVLGAARDILAPALEGQAVELVPSSSEERTVVFVAIEICSDTIIGPTIINIFYIFQ